MTPKTETHDYNFKLAQARRFLEEGHKVKVSIFFRGRQIVHKELGEQLLERIQNDLSKISEVESTAKFAGRIRHSAPGIGHD